MKRLLILLLLLSTPLYANQAMFNKLKEAANVHVKVVVFKGNEPSYTDGTGVYLSTEDVRLCKGVNMCLESIVAHELSHIVLGHTNGPGSNIRTELQADLYSIKILKKAGYNPCSPITYMIVFQKKFGNYGGGTHPNYDVRIKAVQKECIK